MEINTQEIPASMATRALAYNFQRRELGAANGRGVIQPAGPQSLTWLFERLTYEEIAWWDAFLSGAKSVELTQAQLYDNRRTLRTFTYGVLHEPQVEKYSAGAYWGVTIFINHLLPLD